MAKRRVGGKLPEPIAVQGHHPRLMSGYGALELAFGGASEAPDKLKLLMELKAGAIVGCEWCLDFGSWLASDAGISEQQLRAIPAFRDSDLFARLRARFDEAQIVELTHAAAIENLRARSNWALGIGSQGYAEQLLHSAGTWGRDGIGSNRAPHAPMNFSALGGLICESEMTAERSHPRPMPAG